MLGGRILVIVDENVYHFSDYGKQFKGILKRLEMQLPNNASVEILAVKGVIEISGKEPSTIACLVHLYSQHLSIDSINMYINR